MSSVTWVLTRHINSVRIFFRAILSNESCVFEAMFSGDFAESNQSGISIKLTSKPAIVALFHYLYGCRNCILLRHLDVNTLVELVSLSDKFLVSDFNRTISGRIVRQCLVTDQVLANQMSTVPKS